MKAGSLVFFCNTLGWYGKSQKFFTKQPFTHVAIVYPDQFDKHAILSSDMAITVKPFEYIGTPTSYQLVFNFNVEDEKVMESVKQIYFAHAGQTYGFFQLLWFIYRWFMWTYLKQDVRKQHNWFPDDVVCSETGYEHFSNVFAGNTTVQLYLDKFRRDTVSAGDIAYLCLLLHNAGFGQLEPHQFTLEQLTCPEERV
jgi:hypothetical protein